MLNPSVFLDPRIGLPLEWIRKQPITELARITARFIKPVIDFSDYKEPPYFIY
jgi:hypothetical protein